MESIVRISSSFSEPWVAWLMLGLLIMICVANHFQQGMLLSAFSSLFSVKERDSIFTQSSTDIRGQILITLYNLGVMALGAYVVFYTDGQFSLITYLKILGLIMAVLAAKLLISVYLGYVYTSSETITIFFNHYTSLITATTTMAYPCLLVCLFVPQIPQTLVWIMAVALLAFFFVCLIVKLFRFFFNKLLVCFYILLYLCTLEFLPLALIVAAVKWVA